MNSAEEKISPVAALGERTLNSVRELGLFTIFFVRSFTHIFSFPFQLSKIAQQIYFIGVKSIFVISLTASFTGMVLGLQLYYTMVKFGSEGVLGGVVALTLIRELGPVLAAIMVAGRAGSAIAAEIGIMRISEQIDALETMDINPIRFIISPKFAASLISFPILTAFFDIIGIIGGYITGCLLLGLNPGIYYYRVQSFVQIDDVTGGLIKSIVFGAVVAAICCYQGFYTHKRPDGFGARGVSNSTTTAVVHSCVIILLVDYVLTSILL